MFARLAALAAPLLLAASALCTPQPRGPTDGQILKPTSGSTIAPGQAFDFLYDSYADYGRSSYNFTVWLVTGTTAQPSSPSATSAPGFPFAAGDLTGHYFGRYAYANYPGNPSPKNEAPAQLVMPDFSKSPGGFGAGAVGSDRTVWLAVVEEWASGQGVMGTRMHTATTRIVYNGTVKA